MLLCDIVKIYFSREKMTLKATKAPIETTSKKLFNKYAYFVNIVWSGPLADLGENVRGSSKILIQDFFHRSREFLFRRSVPHPAPRSGVL